MFKSFFPKPGPFFISAFIWSLLAVIFWQAGGGDWLLRVTGASQEVAISAARFWSLNYLVFFSGHWLNYARNRNLQVRQAARRADMGPVIELPVDRTCALCGKTQSSGADIRVCSCAKCGGQARNLCLEHARNH